MTQHLIKDTTFALGTEKPHVFPSETSSVIKNVLLNCVQGYLRLRKMLWNCEIFSPTNFGSN